MKRHWVLCVPVLAGLILCSPLLAYQLAMKDGRIVEFQKYRIEKESVVYTAADGKETSVPLAEVDLERTKALNAKETPPLDLSPAPAAGASPAAGPAEEPSLGDTARNLRQQGKAHAASLKHKFTDEDMTHPASADPATEETDANAAPGSGTQGGKPAKSTGTKSTQRKEVTDAQISEYYDLGRTETANAVLEMADLPPDTPFPDRSEWEARLYEGKKEWVPEYVHCKEHPDDEAACNEFATKFRAWLNIANEGVERAKQYLATHPNG